jgi:hypothetical protein
VLAVLVGLAAIRVIGNGLTTRSTPALSAAEVAERLSRVTPAASASLGSRPSDPAVTTSPATAPPPTMSTTVEATRGGTVVARCDGSRAEIITMTPELGFTVHEQNGAEGEFRLSSDNHDRVKIRVTCVAGVPGVSWSNRD